MRNDNAAHLARYCLFRFITLITQIFLSKRHLKMKMYLNSVSNYTEAGHPDGRVKQIGMEMPTVSDLIYQIHMKVNTYTLEYTRATPGTEWFY